MTTMTNIGRTARMLFLVAAGATAGIALAQGPGYAPGPGSGPGYGSGMGPGMMGEHGGGMGHGPGHGMGPGAMGGGHTGGPGAGMGPGGMMHGGQPGMMGGHGEHMARALGLSEDQRAKAGRVMEDARRKSWDALGQIQSERFKLREMVRGDKVDPSAAVEQQRKIDDLKRQVMHARLEARNQMLALLTPEQREKARGFGPGH